MRGKVDLVGVRFGRLVVLERAANDRIYPVWVCKCDCGSVKEVRSIYLRSGGVKSCGCLHRDFRRTHGASETGLYKLWSAMRQRCANPKNKRYADYGGRGITVCERWLDFSNFKSDMGEPPTPSHTLDRKDNDGNYDPENCHWATRLEQMNNMRRNRTITAFGETKTLTEWGREVRPHKVTISRRLAKGIPPEVALMAGRVTVKESYGKAD